MKQRQLKSQQIQKRKVEIVFVPVLTKVLRWLNTVLAVSEYVSFANLWQEKGCSSQAETWQVENILMKDFDSQVKFDIS